MKEKNVAKVECTKLSEISSVYSISCGVKFYNDNLELTDYCEELKKIINELDNNYFMGIAHNDGYHIRIHCPEVMLQETLEAIHLFAKNALGEGVEVEPLPLPEEGLRYTINQSFEGEKNTLTVTFYDRKLFSGASLEIGVYDFFQELESHPRLNISRHPNHKWFNKFEVVFSDDFDIIRCHIEMMIEKHGLNA